ncbi:putative Integral membrane protein [Seiridium unicorne]|uniref:Integral membrane protein n=1 Tax=Seiridium unicorne TaxID=138068 RepID=A0ABR2USF5_9PEZI
MADQITTVAGLPPGFATLVGLIYAMTVILPNLRSHTSWTKMSEALPFHRVDAAKLRGHPSVPHDRTRVYNTRSSDDAASLEALCAVISRAATSRLRGAPWGSRGGQTLPEWIAVLHLLRITLSSDTMADLNVVNDDREGGLPLIENTPLETLRFVLRAILP